jgi:DNA-binding Xre family transcriptional regulator
VKRLPAAFYELPSGRQPVRGWLLSLSKDDRKIIGADIKDVEFAWPIGMPLCRHLGKGLVAEDAGQRSESMSEANVGDHIVKKKKGRIGSSFDAFLREDGIYEEVTACAIKRVIARQLGALMQDQSLTKTALARRMKTSRTQLDRLLDPNNDSVTLGTLARAAQAVGRQLRMEIV